MASRWVVYWLFDDTCSDPKRDGCVGATGRLWQRMNQYRNNKGGRTPTDFRIEILLRASKDECLAYEAQLRPIPGIGWNFGIGGYGSGRGQRGIPKPAEWRAKQSIAALKRYADPTERERTAQAVKQAFANGDFRRRKGDKYRHSKETKRKISRARKGQHAGEKNPMFGTPRTEAVKQAIRAKLQKTICHRGHTKEPGKPCRECGRIAERAYKERKRQDAV